MESRNAPINVPAPPKLAVAQIRDTTTSSSTTYVPGWPLLMSLAMVLTGLLYLPSLTNGITNWDDSEYLTANPLLDFSKTPVRVYFSTIISGNLHPLTMLSLSLDYALGGVSARQVHTTSLLLHVLNVGLTFGLVWQLAGGRRLVSFLVALWFGIHPMHVESVAWISERKDVLYGFFFLLSLIAYWHFLSSRRWFSVGLSLLTALLTNWAKPAAVILPAVLVLLTSWHKKSLTANRLLATLPFFILSAVFAWVTLNAQTSAAAINTNFTLAERLQLGGYALVNYLLKAVWPVGLSALYGRPGPGSVFPAVFMVYTVLSGLGLAGMVWLYRRSALVLKTQPYSATAYSNRALYYEQNGRPDEALADNTVAIQADPRPLYRANRAYMLTRMNRPAEAESDADFLLAQTPDNTLALNTKGTALVQRNEAAAAIGYLTRSYALNSTYLNTVANLGSACFTNKQYAEAVRYYKKALVLSPDNPAFLTNLGATYLQNNQFTEAAKACQQAIAHQPGNGQAHLFACYALHKTGNKAEARAMATRAHELGQTIDPRILAAL